MKKLVIAATSLIVAASAFAAVDVYDYKASVKYVDMKPGTVRIDTGIGTIKVNVLFKTVKTASLTGYLVNESCCGIGAGAKVFGYLVVANKASSADKGAPKVMPADLLAKYWYTSETAKTVDTEGYLFAGYGKFDNPYTYGNVTPGSYDGSGIPSYRFGRSASYGTEFLFGKYNAALEQLVDDPNDPTGPQIKVYTFADAWLDASGFGKGTRSAGVDGGCSLGTPGSVCLDTLSGSVIGGLYICHPNGYPVDSMEEILCAGWEGTTDVITGIWSIKRTAKVVGEELTDVELPKIPDNRSQELIEYVKGASNKIKIGSNLVSFFDMDDPAN